MKTPDKLDGGKIATISVAAGSWKPWPPPPPPASEYVQVLATDKKYMLFHVMSWMTDRWWDEESMERSGIAFYAYINAPEKTEATK